MAARDDVRLDAVVLVGEEVAGAAEPALHLVGDQQRLVLVQQFLRAAQESRRRDGDALALDRLDQEAGDVAARAARARSAAQVAERDRGVGQQRAEALAELAARR